MWSQESNFLGPPSYGRLLLKCVFYKHELILTASLFPMYTDSLAVNSIGYLQPPNGSPSPNATPEFQTQRSNSTHHLPLNVSKKLFKLRRSETTLVIQPPGDPSTNVPIAVNSPTPPLRVLTDSCQPNPESDLFSIPSTKTSLIQAAIILCLESSGSYSVFQPSN